MAVDESERSARIGALAHQIWEAEGRPDGQQQRHWHMAERLVQAEMTAQPQARAKGRGSESAAARVVRAGEASAEPAAEKEPLHGGS